MTSLSRSPREKSTGCQKSIQPEPYCVDAPTVPGIVSAACALADKATTKMKWRNRLPTALTVRCMLLLQTTGRFRDRDT
jgi:hypothetical protein